MRRRFIAMLAVVVLALSTAGQAAAFHCFVAKKPIGAGSAATIDFDVVTDPDGEPDFDNVPFNPFSERVVGAWVTLHITAAGQEVGTWDLFFQNTVGGKAHAAGPDGANECDGVGMDDLLACLGIEE